MIKIIRFLNFFSLILVIVVASCTTNIKETVVENVYPINKIPIKAKRLVLPIENVSQVFLIDTILYCRNQQDKSFNLFETLDDRFLGSFQLPSVDKAIGVNSSVQYSNQYWKENGELKIVLVDQVANKIMICPLSSVINGNRKNIELVNIPYELVRNYSYIFLDKNKGMIGNYMGLRYNKKFGGRFFSYQPSLRPEISWVPNFPKVKLKIPHFQLYEYYYSYPSLNRDLGIYAAAMQRFKRVDFLDINSGKINSIVFKPYDQEEAAYPATKKTLTYFNESYAGKKYYYATGIDAPYESYAKNNGCMNLYVFNWTGTLKKIIKLDQMKLGNFAIDEPHQKMYTVKFEEGHRSAVLKYDLSNFKL